MTHAETILRALDRHLTEPVELILYGRAALALGFQPPLSAAALSMDVDVILPMEQSANLDSAPAFWEALEAANAELDPAGLYLTHLFEESQIILRPDWKDHIVPIELPALPRLRLFRPHALDLVLTKMMRGPDPQDMEDADFIITAARLSPPEIERAIGAARVPEVPEIREAFNAARPIILRLASESGSAATP